MAVKNVLSGYKQKTAGLGPTVFYAFNCCR